MRRPNISVVSSLVHRAARLGSASFGGNFGKHGELTPLPQDVYVEAEGIRFHALHWAGQGDPVVMLHGLGSNPWVWGEVGAILSGTRPLYALAMPGHGRTRYDGTFETQTVAGLVVSALDLLCPGTLALVGHSWGGKVAAVVASLLGDRCQELVLADPAPPKGMNPVIKRFPKLASAVFEPERGPFPDRASMEKSLRTLLYLHRWGDLEQRIARESFWHRAGETRDGGRETRDGGAIGDGGETRDGGWYPVLCERAFGEILHNCLFEDTSASIPAIRCPVLLLRPTYSLSVLPGELAELRGHGFVLTQQRIQGDHDFNVTNPIDTACALRGFLRFPVD